MSTTRRLRTALAALLAAVMVAACGSGQSGRPTLPAAPSDPFTSGSAAPSGPAATADQLYADYLTALRAARSEHYAGNVAFSDGTSVSIDVTATQTTAHLLAHTGGITLEEIVAGDTVFQRGGVHGPGWVTLPPAEALSALALTMQREAGCAATEHGHLSLGARTRINGLPVATLIDDGRGPGAAPQTAYVTLDAPVHIVRVVQTGVQSPGGTAECGHEAGPVAVSAKVDYDRFGSAVTITPPPNPTDLGGGQTA